MACSRTVLPDLGYGDGGRLPPRIKVRRRRFNHSRTRQSSCFCVGRQTRLRYVRNTHASLKLCLTAVDRPNSVSEPAEKR
ncbi:hypothetical protein RB3650 [Rhodopirellula baltica SH 1]|uniref:Uncharacterized protein n=1 Tax=Rhodopirellula baltica (strain DSM 10527 / NCIMB 13988 / SH1) TaxID=243090 RepID=Q7UTW5_RHOBA|nr:hypothetical protein RB3650 [Rhodopirellula baltica SH 1]